MSNDYGNKIDLIALKHCYPFWFISVVDTAFRNDVGVPALGEFGEVAVSVLRNLALLIDAVDWKCRLFTLPKNLG